MPKIAVAVVWAQFGPYHIARLRALRAVESGFDFLGVEISDTTETYAWSREKCEDLGIVSLIPGQTAEKPAATDIYKAALALFVRQKIEVVFVPSYWPASSLAIWAAARNAGAKTVMMNDSHALTARASGLAALVKRCLVKSFNAAFVAGQPQVEYFASLGFPKDRILTGYDSVDNDHFASLAAAARANEDAHRVRLGLPRHYFLNVGRMVKKKNLSRLITAYVEAKQRRDTSPHRLVFVGTGPMEGELIRQCIDTNLTVFSSHAHGPDSGSEFDVYFLGFKQINELPFYYALSDGFILPSIEEEWGLVVNEAMASGTPVLVSKVAGCARDLVGDNGFVFDPTSTSELANLLVWVTEHKEEARKMGRASQVRIAGWSCDNMARAAIRAAEIASGRYY